jgi:hypothetical protein
MFVSSEMQVQVQLLIRKYNEFIVGVNDVKRYVSIKYNHFGNRSKMFSASHILASSDNYEETNEGKYTQVVIEHKLKAFVIAFVYINAYVSVLLCTFDSTCKNISQSSYLILLITYLHVFTYDFISLLIC